jgi:integral membrane sensor domain MASE1
MPLAYFVAAALAVHLTQAFGNVASIWLSTGILLAALVRHEPRVWPALALLAAAADLAASLAVGPRPRSPPGSPPSTWARPSSPRPCCAGSASPRPGSPAFPV